METTQAITKLDISAMKKADYICFRYNARNKLSQIDCVKEIKDEPFGYSKHYSIDVGIISNGNNGKGIMTNGSNGNGITGYASISYSSDNLKWQTIVSQIRIGDTIKLHWYRNAGESNLLKEHGIVCDYLYLRVYRGKKIFEYFIDACNSTADSSARMIRTA